jgi:hypothetical protein
MLAEVGTQNYGPHVERTRDEHVEQDGVRFLMADEVGNTVACRVSHEALRDHADRVHLPVPTVLSLRLIAN